MKNSMKSNLEESMISTCTLLSRINREIDIRINAFNSTLSIPSGARRVLACLNTGDNLSQLNLVHATKLKAPTISLIVQKMEKDGLITRSTDDIDMRMTRVRMTDKGMGLERKLSAFADELENLALNGFSEDEKRRFPHFSPVFTQTSIPAESNPLNSDGKHSHGSIPIENISR